MASTLRIAHLSDPHFYTFDTHLLQFFSKRWVGNWNFRLFRKHIYDTHHLFALPPLLASLETRYLFITGDFTSTSLDEEFYESKKLYNLFLERGIGTFTLPGNHDVYTKHSEEKKHFYSFFPSQVLRDKGVESIKLENGWWYIGLDCARATPLFCSYGHFTSQIESALKEALIAIPLEDKVIVCCHFPLLSTSRPLHDLKRSEALRKIFKTFRQIKLYLHGHDHNPYIIEQQREDLPLIINAGSCAKREGGCFNIIDLFDKECLVKRYVFRKQEGWTHLQDQRYLL